jgi:hypothetical protein
MRVRNENISIFSTTIGRSSQPERDFLHAAGVRRSQRKGTARIDILSLHGLETGISRSPAAGGNSLISISPELEVSALKAAFQRAGLSHEGP